MHSIFRVSTLVGVVLAAAFIGGCTVRPMLATSTGALGSQESVMLSSVNVAPVRTRQAQEVRNHLIFLLHGGSTQPENAPYRLDLSVTQTVTSTVRVQVRRGLNEPTAGGVHMSGTYALVDTATGDVVARGGLEVTASFDRPLQEFAVVRAERDAENRAARELAEFIRLSVAMDLVRRVR